MTGNKRLKIKKLKTEIIIPMQERECPAGFIFRLTNGDLVVGGEMSGLDWPVDRHTMPLPPGQISHRLSWRRSKDGGCTWQETPPWPSYATYQFPDSEIIQASGRWWQTQTDRNDICTFNLFCSIDNGYLWKQQLATVIDVPKLAVPIHQGYRTVFDCYANINHHIVQINDGSLLAAVQAKFESDIKERCFIIRSSDRGKSWSYVSSVVFDLIKNDTLRTAFDEPDLLVLPDNQILCFMRTGARLYLSRSIDAGRSWSHADAIGSHSAYPTSCLMENGIIAVTYGSHHPSGLPGNWLIFSVDRGQTWTSEFCLYSGSPPPDCTGYGWIEEIAEDTLLIVYSRTDSLNRKISEIVGTYLTVKPKIS